MEMAGTTGLVEHLHDVKWIPCSIENKEYILKFLYLNSSYQLMISDFINLYYEALSDLEIQRRCELLNPGIEVSLERILKQLEKCMKHLTQISNAGNFTCVFTMRVQTPVNLVLRSESVMFQMSFLWHFNLDLKEPITISTHLLQPLMGMVSELKRRNEELIKIIKKKDEEIEDYKTSGGKVSRRNLETKIFDEAEFLSAMEKSQGMIDCLRNPARSAFECSLYNVVSSVHKELSKKALEVCDGPSEAKRTKDISNEKTNTGIASTKISKSAIKQEEIQRRHLLQQQLDLKVKKKPNKKLLKL